MKRALSLADRRRTFELRVEKAKDSFIVHGPQGESVALELLPWADGMCLWKTDQGQRLIHYSIDGMKIDLQLGSRTYSLTRKRSLSPRAQTPADEDLRAPMPGKVVKIFVSPGERVSAGDALCSLEAMKMEFSIKASFAGVVTKINAKIGDQIDAGVQIVEVGERE